MSRPGLDTPKGRARAITADTAARLLMVTPARLKELIAAGWIPKPNRGQLDTVDVVQGYVRFLKSPEGRAAPAP